MKILTERYDYHQINRTDDQGKRLYLCPDGFKVPSVTTILSATQPIEKQQALANWRLNVGEKKADAICAEASGRGTRMHKYLEDFISNGELTPFGSNPYSKQAHLMASTIITHGFPKLTEIWGSEIGLYYPELYAGTSDAIGIHQYEGAILDYKQSNKPKKEEHINDYFLQLVAYALCHNKIYGTNIRKGVILMCVKPPEISPGKWGEPQYQEFILEGEAYDQYVELWWDRVSLYYEKFA